VEGFVKIRYFRVPGADRSGASESPTQASFAGTLLRPYLDLGTPLAPGPRLAGMIALDLGDLDAPRVDVCWSPARELGLRANLVRDPALGDYATPAPRELEQGLQTDAWKGLSADLAAWTTLDLPRRVRRLRLLSRLGFHSTVLELATPSPTQARAEVGTALLALHYARARAACEGAGERALRSLLLQLASDHSDPYLGLGAALDLLASVSASPAATGPERARTVRLVAERADHIDERGTVRDRAWSSVHHARLALVRSSMGGCAEAKAALDRAEALADDAPPSVADEADELISAEAGCEIVHARLALALAEGDKASAVRHGHRLAASDPHDAMLQAKLGDTLFLLGSHEEAVAAYRVAALLGAPVRAHAWSMIGRCYETLQKRELALDAYLESARRDPTSTAPLQRAQAIADQLGRTSLVAWTQVELAGLARAGRDSSRRMANR
jgi:tetratricopeptide (TPR) repeat protein